MFVGQRYIWSIFKSNWVSSFSKLWIFASMESIREMARGSLNFSRNCRKHAKAKVDCGIECSLLFPDTLMLLFKAAWLCPWAKSGRTKSQTSRLHFLDLNFSKSIRMVDTAALSSIMELRLVSREVQLVHSLKLSSISTQLSTISIRGTSAEGVACCKGKRHCLRFLAINCWSIGFLGHSSKLWRTWTYKISVMTSLPNLRTIGLLASPLWVSFLSTFNKLMHPG